jgi:hypothetical protein
MKDRSILSTFRSAQVKGLGTGISIALATTTLFAAAAAMKMFSAEEVISATELNRNFEISAPDGAPSWPSIYQTEGWAIADGTPDLRGRFIRGLDDVGAGGPANVDPDTAARTTGSIQLDAFQGPDTGIVSSAFRQIYRSAMEATKRI